MQQHNHATGSSLQFQNFKIFDCSQIGDGMPLQPNNPRNTTSPTMNTQQWIVIFGCSEIPTCRLTLLPASGGVNNNGDRVAVSPSGIQQTPLDCVIPNMSVATKQQGRLRFFYRRKSPYGSISIHPVESKDSIIEEIRRDGGFIAAEHNEIVLYFGADGDNKDERSLIEVSKETWETMFTACRFKLVAYGLDAHENSDFLFAVGNDCIENCLESDDRPIGLLPFHGEILDDLTEQYREWFRLNRGVLNDLDFVRALYLSHAKVLQILDTFERGYVNANGRTQAEMFALHVLHRFPLLYQERVHGLFTSSLPRAVSP